MDISRGLDRVQDGRCTVIPWSEFIAWREITGNEPTREEFALLRAIDVAYVDEMDKELQAYQERMKEKSKSKKG